VKEEPSLPEPVWRIMLNYGSVIYFLGLPAMGIVIGFAHIDFAVGTQIPQFLKEFHFTVSALVATVAGLNTFERRKTNGPKPPPNPPQGKT
jgi:hypothetical protein